MAAGGLKLLFDENISHRHVEFLASESRLTHFQHMRRIGWSGKKDIEWMPLAVHQGFTIVTWDRNDRTREYTVADLKAMGARVMLIGEFFDHMTGWEKAKWLVTRIERMVKFAESMGDGTVCLVDRFGTCHAL